MLPAIFFSLRPAVPLVVFFLFTFPRPACPKMSRPIWEIGHSSNALLISRADGQRTLMATWMDSIMKLPRLKFNSRASCSGTAELLCITSREREKSASCSVERIGLAVSARAQRRRRRLHINLEPTKQTTVTNSLRCSCMLLLLRYIINNSLRKRWRSL